MPYVVEGVQTEKFEARKSDEETLYKVKLEGEKGVPSKTYWFEESETSSITFELVDFRKSPVFKEPTNVLEEPLEKEVVAALLSEWGIFRVVASQELEFDRETGNALLSEVKIN